MADTNKGEEGLLGDIEAVVGAMFYAAYSVFLKWKGRDIDMIVLYGFVGVINVFMFFAGIIILNYAGIEVFWLPTGIEAGFLVINAIFGTFISDFLWALSVMYLNPTLCTVGLSLTIPFSIIADIILYNM